MQKVILASASKQRRQILEALGVAFEVVPANIDEKSIRASDPKTQAEKIARAKAEAVAKSHDGIVIAGDSFVVHQGKILEKPADNEAAHQMLLALSGSSGQHFTGFCYLDKANGVDFSTVKETKFSFRTLNKEEIALYIKNFPVTTWSAAFAPAYVYGMTLLAELNGPLTAMIFGLPADELVLLLQKSGIAIKPTPFDL